MYSHTIMLLLWSIKLAMETAETRLRVKITSKLRIDLANRAEKISIDLSPQQALFKTKWQIQYKLFVEHKLLETLSKRELKRHKITINVYRFTEPQTICLSKTFSAWRLYKAEKRYQKRLNEESRRWGPDIVRSRCLLWRLFKQRYYRKKYGMR